MRRATIVALTLTAACTTTAQPVQDRTCNAEGSESFVGRTASSETGAAILRATHSSVLRWAPPGVMLTMDFSPSRVTVRLGPDGKITAINCG